MIKREIRTPLVNTWETLDMLRAQYEESFKNPKLEKIRDYYDNMDTYERDILVLYSEYNSYRMVAEETYCSYGTIKIIIKCIQQDIFKILSA